MTPERLALYSAKFPNGLASIFQTWACSAQGVIDRGRGKFLPAAAKKPLVVGAQVVKLQIDPNGHPYERADILLSVQVAEQMADWLVLAAGKRFAVRSGDFGDYYYQYVIVRRATAEEVAPAKAANDAARKAVMDWARNH